MTQHPVLALMGPTAVGKTAVAISLARALATRLRVEIVSMDSALVYRGMDVGTGKPGVASRSGIPHHLIDIRDPHEPYSAADFARDARRLVGEIFERGACPMLVGGTGLYYRAFQHGLSPMPGADPALRRELESEARRVGWPAMHRRLARIDPQAAARIPASDPQRIQRALEVHALTGVTLSALHERATPQPCPWPVAAAALIPRDRGWLHQRIARRFEDMLARGLEREACTLRSQAAADADLPAMRAVGYRQVIQHLDGQLDRPAMVEAALAATRQLARRQLTWLRKERLDAVFDPGDVGLEASIAHWARDRLGV